MDITVYNLPGVAILRVFEVAEPASPKPGDSGLKLLEVGSNLIVEESIVPEGVGASVGAGVGAGVGGSATAAENNPATVIRRLRTLTPSALYL